MDKQSLKKYTKNILIVTGILLAVNMVTTIPLYLKVKQNHDLIISALESSGYKNSNQDEKKPIEKYNIENPKQIDFSLALVDIFNTKLNFLYVEGRTLEKSELENYALNNIDTLFVNSKLSTESSNRYKEFEKTLSQPLSQEDVSYAQKVLAKGNKLNEQIDKYNFLTPSFKKSFTQNLKELAILSGSEQAIAITNVYKENIRNKEFQTLVQNQETEALWDKYFKANFGDVVSDIAYLQDGTFSKKVGVK